MGVEKMKNVAFAATIWLALSVVAFAECPRYEVTAVFDPADVCGEDGGNFFPYGINDHGHIVGQLTCGLAQGQVFVWLGDGVPVFLPMPPGTETSRPEAISNSGDIVGRLNVAGDEFGSLAFLHRNGTTSILRLPPGSDTGVATGVNDAGVITGSSWAFGQPPQMVLWEDDDPVDIGSPLGVSRTVAEDINNLGQITGYLIEEPGGERVGYVWVDGNVTKLGPIPGGDNSWPFDINNHGAAVGRGDITLPNGGFVRHGFLWTGAKAIDLGLVAGYTRGFAWEINDSGDVVGDSSHSEEPGVHAIATIWRNQRPWDLNAVIVGGPYESLRIAAAINNRGQIAAIPPSGKLYVLSPVAALAGDLICNARVDFEDLLALLSGWGECGACDADLDENGAVGPEDLAILIDHWGR